MNKQLITAILSASLAFGGISAFADGVITGVSDGENIVLENIEGTSILVNGFDSEGNLKYANLFEAKDNKAVIPASLSDYYLKAYDINSENMADTMSEVIVSTPAPESTATPAPETTPAPTQAPDSTPAPTSNVNVFPPVYEKAINAVNAFSVIESVSMEEKDGDIGYKLDFYYQGEKRSEWVGSDVSIVSAPDYANYLIDSDISSLKRGDVVYFDRGIFYKEIRQISVIFSAQSSDLITSSEDYGTNFQKLFSVNGTSVGGYSGWGVQSFGAQVPSSGTKYAFGLVARREGTVLYLMNKTGLGSNMIEITAADDTIVYECDMNARQGIEAARINDLQSAFSTTQWNNILSFPDQAVTFDASDSYSYALVRIVDGKAMDIIVYTNY